MEETLGKRIVAGRKRLGITQDRLAEQLGVTAQAVSKWENDQSCPDITMLPKLAEIFGTTTDALLGITPAVTEPAKESVAEPIEEQENEGLHLHKGNWEFWWDAGRKSNIGLAIWIILTAGWMFVSHAWRIDVPFWDLLWTNGLMIFGIFGLFPRFSFFRLGCALVGGYFLLDKLNAIPVYLGRDLLLPAFLLLFGLSLLVDALRKPKGSRVSVIHNGKKVGQECSNCSFGDDTFNCECCFSSKHQIIALPRFRSGSAEVNFGELTVNLCECEEFTPECTMDAECNFGSLTILVPKHCRAEVDADTAFGSVDVRGNHEPETSAIIHIDADANFGQIVVQYI